MKYGEVFDYRTAEEARQFIGTRGAFSDTLKRIIECPMQCWGSSLTKVEEENSCPFNGKGLCSFQFFRPILEEDEPLMTNRQLAEWLAKGNGEYTYETSSLAFNYWQYSKGNEDNKPVGGYIHIRRWKDTEWMKPTKAIYEEDCIPNTAINKEDCK